jgi:hypothetical protein
MVRTQVQLTEEQVRALKRLSAATDSSVADLIRQGVELYLGRQQRAGRDQQIERALRVAGKFSSGSTDGSVEHDRYLAEAFRG